MPSIEINNADPTQITITDDSSENLVITPPVPVNVNVETNSPESVNLTAVGPQGPQGNVGEKGVPGQPGLGAPSGSYPTVATNLIRNPIAASLTNPNITLTNGTAALLSNAYSDPINGQSYNGFRFTYTGGTGAGALYLNRGTGLTVPSIPGNVYRASAWVRPSKSTSYAIRISVGATSQSQTTAVLLADVWTYMEVLYTETLSQPLSFGIITSANQNSNGDTVDIVQPMFTENTPFIPYFDGNTPGASWTGATGLSQSRLVAPRRVDLQVFSKDSNRYIEGSGMPNGVIRGFMGDTYLDTAFTNGARLWRNTTAGYTNTGWVCTEGDTGWRDVASAWQTNAGAFTGTPLIRIRRVNSEVWWFIQGTLAGTTQTIGANTVASGWRLRGTMSPVSMFGSGPSGGVLNGVYFWTGGFSFGYGTGTSGSISQVSGSYPTDDPWPTSLPGTVG